MNFENKNKEPYKKLRLSSIFKSGDYADCYFIIDGEKIPAHKILLACSSPVFEQMFLGPLSTAEKAVELVDVEAKDFKKVLEFIYTDKVIIDSVQEAWNLYHIADKYMLEDLIASCIRYIERNLTIDTLALSYDLSELYEEQRLLTSCWSDMILYTKGVILYESEYHMKSSTFCRLLRESLALNYYDKLIFIVKWAVNESKNESSIEEVLGIINNLDVLQYIPKIHPDSLPQDDLKAELTPHEESVMICCIKKLHFNDRAEVPLGILSDEFSMRARNRCKTRELYKIARDVSVAEDIPLHFIIESSRKVLLFGLIINTEHEPPDTYAPLYDGIIRISVRRKNTQDRVHAYFRSVMSYDSTQYVPFNNLVVLEVDEPYDVLISYRNLYVETNSVILHYLDSKLICDKYDKKQPVFSFFENFGSVIRAVCFYPL